MALLVKGNIKSSKCTILANSEDQLNILKKGFGDALIFDTDFQGNTTSNLTIDKPAAYVLHVLTSKCHFKALTCVIDSSDQCIWTLSSLSSNLELHAIK